MIGLHFKKQVRQGIFRDVGIEKDTTDTRPRTLFDKVWSSHIVVPETADTPAILYVDVHLVQEVSSPQAFEVLRTRGFRVRQPLRTIATADHSTPTVAQDLYGKFRTANTAAALQVRTLTENCAEFGIELYGIDHERRGIVHVIGPELGLTQPGRTIVCGDSHTSTHGAFGAFAFGIGSTEVAHVLATQCLLQRKPRTFAINLSGALAPGVSAKDVILATIGKIGVDGATNHVIEFRGSTVRSLSMEQRMTICNMSIEAGGRAGMMAPDDTTFEYMADRPMSPIEDNWDAALDHWRSLSTDDAATFDSEVDLDMAALAPQVTFGTNPGMVIPIDGRIPSDLPETAAALSYMGLNAGDRLLGQPIDVAFVGSCTNGRLSDLREVATVLDSNRVADGVKMLIVPGSQEVKRQAESEGLHEVFLNAGALWRESGCSMCLGMNGDLVDAGAYSISTSNRNFAGRQGPGARTILASPQTVAASAVAGQIADPRILRSA